MPALIGAFERLTAELDACDYWVDPMGWDAIADRRCRALEALLDERSASVAEFADKFEALISITAEDTDFTVLRLLADDIRALSVRGEA
jgi:hypothetical protein